MAGLKLIVQIESVRPRFVSLFWPLLALPSIDSNRLAQLQLQLAYGLL
jgi:hypothetical protein